MITKSFFDLAKKEKERTFEIEDIVDRLNWSISCKLFLLSFLIIVARVYWNSAFECYTPVAPSGKDFDKFAKEFGWIYSKFSKLPGKNFRQIQDNSEPSSTEFTLNYYMWTPFYLSLAAILIYLPHVILAYVSRNAVDMDLQNSLAKARSVAKKTGPIPSESVLEITENMKRMLKSRRPQPTGWLSSFKNRIYGICPILVPSKRNGTVLTCTYLFVTMMNLVFSLVIVIGMAKFVGYTNVNEYVRSLGNLIHNQDHANDIPRFPKIAYAVMPITDQTMTNYYPLQCILAMNMVWEKLFIMLSLWMIGIVIINAIKLVSLMVNTVSRRVSFVKDLLMIRANEELYDIKLIERFTEEFLKHDGVMILQSLVSNSGRSAASYILWELWSIYSDREQNLSILRISVN